MHLFAETFEKTLLVLNSDGFQGGWWKEVTETFLDGIRKGLNGVYVPPDTLGPKTPGMPRKGANAETVHWSRQKSAGRKELL